ncbi:hypothetical protein [Shewanella phage FishSpeaker]|nr:hypothetical protein [Shewanella phage FishSpeaker]
MKANQYGVGKIIFSDNTEKEISCVQFGDGFTQIMTVEWDSKDVGLKLQHNPDGPGPFSERIFYNENHLPVASENPELYLLFDNVKSIDAMIDSLNYIRKTLVEKESVIEVTPEKDDAL